jgi:hypothetical protein
MKIITYKTIISPVVRCGLRDDISRDWRILHNELCGSHVMPRNRIVVGRLLQYFVGGCRVVMKRISGKLVM